MCKRQKKGFNKKKKMNWFVTKEKKGLSFCKKTGMFWEILG